MSAKYGQGTTEARHLCHLLPHDPRESKLFAPLHTTIITAGDDSLQAANLVGPNLLNEAQMLRLEAFWPSPMSGGLSKR